MSQSSEIKVGFQIKGQIRLFIGDRSKVQFDSGCKIFDVYIMDTFEFEKISFQNFYTCYLSIKAKDKKLPSDNPSSWKFLIKRLRLMPNCHGESGSHQRFELTKDMVITYLRIYQKHDSNSLRKYSLIRCFLFLNSFSMIPKEFLNYALFFNSHHAIGKIFQ